MWNEEHGNRIKGYSVWEVILQSGISLPGLGFVCSQISATAEMGKITTAGSVITKGLGNQGNRFPPRLMIL